MADYIYLLEHRLSAAQQRALQVVREVARAQGLTVFLVGGAVRDLTSGSPVRDLDLVVQGNALKLKSPIEMSGGVVTGEVAPWQALFVRFEGGVRVEIGSTLSARYPKPGKPVLEPATILDDLRRRDFTANAMALSLNEGSYGLLMDPLNGVADIENRQLRLVSNYGFIEDPVRMVRAARFAARLGWTLDEKTQARYETGKQEGYIKALDAAHRGYETEEIFHEEDPLRILRKLEEEGWMKHLFPALTVGKTNPAELEKLREVQTQLQMRGIYPEAAVANFPLLSAKLSAGDLAELKKSFVRPGFVAEIEALEGEAKELSALLSGKTAALPSQAWKLLQAAKPEALLWVAYSSKNATIQGKLKSFHTEWPKARQKVPYPLMQEMRIVPELEGFDEIVDKLFYELMDGRLETVEEMKAFLEPFSPPAPPPPVRMSRPRSPKKDAKGARSRKKASAAEDEDETDATPVPLDEEDAVEAIDVDLEDEDEVETEEEATEVMPLRVSAPMATRSAPEPEKPAVRVAAPVSPPVPVPIKPTSPPPVAASPSETIPKKAHSAKQAAVVAKTPIKAAVKQVPAAKQAAVKIAGKPVQKSPAKVAVKIPVKIAAKTTVPAKKVVAVAAKAAAKKAVPVRKAVAPAKKTPVKGVATKKSALPKKTAPAKKVAAKYALGRRQEGRR